MTKRYVKSTRLFSRGRLAAYALGCVSLSAFAQAEIPFNSPKPIVVQERTPGGWDWKPVTGESQKGWPYRPDFSKGTVSNAEPKVNMKFPVPYEHKGPSNSGVNWSAMANRAAVAGGAAKEFAKAAITCGMKPGHPLVVSMSIATCAGANAMMIAAAVEWGIHQLSDDGNGNITASVPAQGYDISSGYIYAHTASGPIIAGSSFLSVCLKIESQLGRPFVSLQPISDTFAYCRNTWLGSVSSHPVTRGSQCSAGSLISSTGTCIASDSAPRENRPLEHVISENIVDKPWNPTSAAVMAGVMTAGHNVFTDGTDAHVTGPSTLPIETTTSSWPVNVISGSTTPAPAGHTGPTDSGTATTTTTTTAQNTYSGSSMTTTKQTETKQSITNNVTNNTSTSVTTNITNNDTKPEEPKSEHCEKYPDTLGCAEFGEVDDSEIPEDQIDVTYEYADLFGNGSCPADLYTYINGQSFKAWDWQQSCSYIETYLKPILIACCAFIAFVIVSGGAKE